jgi:caspase domain-containing protein
MARFSILFGFLLFPFLGQAQTSLEKVKNAPLHAGSSREFSGSFETIVKYAKTALADANLEMEFIERVDEENYMMLGKKRASGFSWGEMVRIVVTRQSGDVESIVHVYTKKRIGVNATAKASYSNTIFSSIESQLELQGDGLGGDYISVRNRATEEAPIIEKTPVSTPVASNYNAENRMALVIGNARYRKAPLKNPVNDALAISRQLKTMGFEVYTYTDASQTEMKNAIRQFGDALNKNSGVGLFYYAGHGVQSKGKNYLIPVDADIEREYDVEDQGVDAGLVLRMMELYQNPLNIIILDACRNNPYSSGFRSIEEGLAPVYIAPTGSIISFATAPGKTASDGDGKNGLFTQELIKAMQQPNKNLEEVFKSVRINVAKMSNNEQIPWTNSSLMGEFYFTKK